MRAVRETVCRVAASNATILITGESGTGKELVADMICRYSNRVGKPCIKFNGAAVKENLLNVINLRQVPLRDRKEDMKKDADAESDRSV